MQAYEVNFDSLVGPTHNYSGLSYGNIASSLNKQIPSNPKEAALQGLKKMKFLADCGIKQGVLPPQERPYIPLLRSIGFSGTDQEIIVKAFQQQPELLMACSSSSSMWAANAATVCPSTDSLDQRVHITPANLSSKLHRSIEPQATAANLKAIFSNPEFFVHHAPLPAGTYFTDEGAANHTRFCRKTNEVGIQLFVFGRYAFHNSTVTEFPARQTFEASQAVARLHQLSPDRTIFAQQNPKAIDAGVFHNDVISVGHQNVFLYHSEAFLDTDLTIKEIQEKMKKFCGIDPIFLPVPNQHISLQDSVKSYLFNSQIVTLPDNTMLLIAPSECQDMNQTRQFIEGIVSDVKNPIAAVKYFKLHESMRNGGGPACLRLRVVLNERELAAVNQNVLLNDQLYNRLVTWINKHYRDRLTPNDLVDPCLLVECREALNELSGILKLKSSDCF